MVSLILASGRPLRILFCGAVFGSAALAYAYYVEPSETDRKRLPHVEAWETQRRPFWDGLAYVSLNTPESIRLTLQSTIQQSRVLLLLSEAQRSDLLDVSTRMLVAFGAESPDAYLSAVSDLRRLKESPHDDSVLLGYYHAATGGPIPVGATTRDVLDALWRAQALGSGRPVEASIGRPDGVGFRVGAWDGGMGYVQYKRDRHWDERWSNVASVSLAPITDPIESSDELALRQGVVDLVLVDFVIRTQRGAAVPMCARFCWNSTVGRWRVEYVFTQTDAIVFWPV